MISAKSGEHSGARSRRWRRVRRHGSHREGCTGGREEGRGREDSHVSSTSRTTAPRRVVPRPAEGVWPGLQDPGENRLRMTVARALVRAAVRRLPLHLVWPDGSVEGDPRGSRAPPHPPGGLLHPPRPPGPHRLRRGVDGRRLGLRRPRRRAALPHRPRRAARAASAAQPAPGLRPRSAARGGRGRRDGVARERPPALRPVERPLQPLPRRVDDVLRRLVRPVRDRPSPSPTAQHRKIDGILDLAGVRAGSRVLEIGTGWGEAAIRAAQRGALRDDADALGRAGGARPRPRRGRPASPTASPSTCATTARPSASTTP